MSAAHDNPFQPPAAIEPPLPASRGEPPLAVYEGGTLDAGSARRRVELFADRVVFFTRMFSGAKGIGERCLADVRRNPDRVWRRRWSIVPYFVVLGPAAAAIIPLTAPGGPCSGPGGVLACLMGWLGLWELVNRLGPLLQPRVEGVFFVSQEGGGALSFLESTPADPAFARFVARVQERIDALQAPAAPPPSPGSGPGRSTESKDGPSEPLEG